MDVKAILLGFDGIIADTNPIIQKAIADHFLILGYELSDETLKKIEGQDIRSAINIISDGINIPLDRNALEEELKDKVHWKIADEAPRLNGVRELLTFARKRGIAVAVISAADQHTMHLTLERMRITGDIACAMSTSDAASQHVKGGMRTFTAGLMGVPVNECLTVEATIENIKQSIAEGFKTVALPLNKDISEVLELDATVVTDLDALTRYVKAVLLTNLER